MVHVGTLQRCGIWSELSIWLCGGNSVIIAKQWTKGPRSGVLLGYVVKHYVLLSLSVCMWQHVTACDSMWQYVAVSIWLCVSGCVYLAVCIWLCLSVYLAVSICLSVYLAVSICLSVYLAVSICLSGCVYLSIWLCLSVYLSIWLCLSDLAVSICLSGCVYLSIWLCLSVYLALWGEQCVYSQTINKRTSIWSPGLCVVCCYISQRPRIVDQWVESLLLWQAFCQ